MDIDNIKELAIKKADEQEKRNTPEWNGLYYGFIFGYQACEKNLNFTHSSLPLKDKYAELSELASNLIKEIQEKHTLMYMPKDEKLYMALHKLKQAIKVDL